MAARVTGHVRLRKFKRRGSAWYVKYRLADGRQVQRLLGPAWTERSRPPVGYFTRKLAEEKLQEILSDARRGTLPDSKQRSGKTFDDACSEWLRYIEHEKERAASTVRDYTKVVNGALLPEFGKDTPLEQITTDRINTYRERLLDEGELSRRTIQKILVLLFGVLKRAKRRGWIPSNPDEDVERVTVKRSGDFNVLGMFTAPGDLVFCTELGEYVNDDRLRERFYAALAAAGLGDKRAGEDPMVFHDLRHTFGTRSAHVRHARGRGMAAARRPSVHGPRRHSDHHDLRPPPAEDGCCGPPFAARVPDSWGHARDTRAGSCSRSGRFAGSPVARAGLEPARDGV
jgi:hypothetical protein